MSGQSSGMPGEAPSAGGGMKTRLKHMFKKYGKVAIGVHLAVYATSFLACYTAVESNLDVPGYLAKVGLLSAHGHAAAEEAAAEGAAQDVSGSGPETEPGWFSRIIAGGGSSLAIAFIANKALFPVRAPITLALTPPVARFLRHMRGT